MAKSEKAVGVNSSGLTDAINWAKETYEDAKTYASEALTPDKGTLVDQLMNRDKDVAKQVDQITDAPKPKPPEKPLTQQTRKKPQRKLSAAEAERARREIQRQKAEGVKAPKYTPES